MMKKRFFSLILSIAAALCGIFAFSACDKKEEENGLSFQTLTADGTNVYGKVSNATETFSFLNEVTARGNSKFTVALDIYGTQSVVTKTIPLAVGDNTAYIMETLDGEMVKMYTVTVRRRAIYTVSFDTSGGTAVQSQQVEEDSLATAPESVPERQGYTFEEWNYDFSQAVTQNTTIAASWKPNTNTAYKVEYYLQNLENEYNYTLRLSENLTGTTGSTVNAEIKMFEHFTHTGNPYYGGASECGVIAGNGSLVLKVYYTRNSYTVTFNGNGGTIQSYDSYKTYTVKYGAKVTAPECMRVGYTFTGWDKQLPETISENITLSAEWKINQYTLTFVYGNGQPDKGITQDYGTAISIETPEREGYDFEKWSNFPQTMPAKNCTVTAKWNAIFTLNESADTITGLTYYGKNKTALIIPNEIDEIKITSIGDGAFYDCTLLTNITIPNSVTSIGGGAFSGCSGLASITIPNSVTSIGRYAFAYCSELTSITIPDGVTYIDENTFCGCSGLTSITILDSVTSIGRYAFAYCSGLASITIPDSVTSIGDSAFYYCRGLENIYYAGSIANWCKISGLYNVMSSSRSLYIDGKKIEGELIIPAGVTSISDSAFYYCRGLTSVTIPNSVTSIGEDAFRGCSLLENISVAEGNAVYYSKDNCLIESDSKTLILGCKNSVIPTDGSVTSIGYSAFSGCSSLKIITIPDSVTSIGYSAFTNCTSLKSITIPHGVTTIYNCAFEGCSSLSKVYYKGTAEEWQKISICDYFSYDSTAYDLTDVKRYYYSETVPTASGNFWHYGENGEIVEW